MEPPHRPSLLTRLRLRWWTRRAARLLERSRCVEAAAWCQMALELDRTHGPARAISERVRAEALRRAAAMDRTGTTPAQAMEAASWCIEAGEADPAGRHARRATRWYARARQEPPPELLLVRGEAAYLAGAHARALKDLSEAARRAGEEGFIGLEAAYYSGLALLASGRRSAALQAFRRVVRKTPWLVPERLEAFLEASAAATGPPDQPVSAAPRAAAP